MNQNDAALDELRRQADLLLAQKRVAEAVALYARIIELDSRNAEHRLRLGTVLAMNGDFDQAITLYQQAIEIDPTIALSYYNLANVQKKVGQIAAAISNLKKAVELDPAWDQALNNLAGTLLYAGYNDEAAHYYQRVLALHPGNIATMLQLANACAADERIAEAIAIYWQVLKLSPTDGPALAALGQLLYNSHRYGELLEYCTYVKRQFPGDPKPYVIEAKVLARQGEWQRAQKIIDELLAKHKPSYDLVTAYALIARPANANRKAIKLIEGVLRKEGRNLSQAEQAELYFSLGRLYDYEGEFAKAFPNFQTANRLTFQGFDLEGLRRFIADMTSVLDKAYFEQTHHSVATSARPVFILGMPRSGTSLVEQILDSHSQVFGGGELYYINQIAQQIGQSDSSYGAAIASLGSDELAHYAQQYLDKIAALDNSARYVTDKMPQNFLHLGLIARLFPNAHIIHCVRNPVDVCLSCYFQSFNQGHEYSNDLDALAGYYRSYHALMQHWKASLDLPFFTLQYENFVEQPEQTIAALLKFLDLPWEEGCMRYYENPRLTMTSSHDQVRQPIYKRSVQRWQHY